jgi:hypothetical protein
LKAKEGKHKADRYLSANSTASTVVKKGKGSTTQEARNMQEANQALANTLWGQ